MNDLLERLFEVMATPQKYSIRQLKELRERARVLKRWVDVQTYTEKLWALGYYD